MAEGAGARRRSLSWLRHGEWIFFVAVQVATGSPRDHPREVTAGDEYLT